MADLSWIPFYIFCLLFSQDHREGEQLLTQYNREGHHPHNKIEPSTDTQPMRDKHTHHCSPTLQYSSHIQPQTIGAHHITRHPIRMLRSHLTVILTRLGYPLPLPLVTMQSNLDTRIVPFLIRHILPVVTMVTMLVTMVIMMVTKETMAFIQVLQLDTSLRANCFQSGHIYRLCLEKVRRYPNTSTLHLIIQCRGPTFFTHRIMVQIFLLTKKSLDTKSLQTYCKKYTF